MNHISDWLQTFSAIFAIVDPFGYIPIFISLTAEDSVPRQREMLKRACATAFIVLTLFTLLGTKILHLFGITIPAVQISGGLILLVIGFEMLKVIEVGEKITKSEASEGVRRDDISIIPLAIPMLSGPASIATVIMLSGKGGQIQYLNIVTSIIATLLITYLILRSAGQILKVIGLTGVKVLTRIMGFLLCAMAVQFMINGYLAIAGRS